MTPHHLTLTDEACARYDTHAKCNPPLRAAADVEALRAALADGTIDAIATDHAPHSPVEKDVEFEQAAFGIIGLETAVPLVLDLVRAKLLTPCRRDPALRGAGRALRAAGRLAGGGAPADVTVIDPEASLDLRAGRSARARATRRSPAGRWAGVLTIVGGAIVYSGRDLVTVDPLDSQQPAAGAAGAGGRHGLPRLRVRRSDAATSSAPARSSSTRRSPATRRS